MTASLGFIITCAWVLSSDETGALVWLSDWARACRDWLLPPMVALPHACLPVRWWIRFAAGTTIKYFRGCRPTGKPRWLKRATGTFLRATFRIHNHRSHRRQIYSLEQPRRMSNDFRGVPLLFPCSLLHSTNNNSLVRFFSSLFGFVSEDAFAHLLSFHCFQGKNLTRLLSS